MITASATLRALYRHPVKGFTPEPLDHADLPTGGYFPDDRLFAVENGPSGFDPAAPVHVSKSHFTVLAQLASLARVRTTWDDVTRRLLVEAPGHPAIHVSLDDPAGRRAFEAWLTDFLGGEANGPLRVVSIPDGSHRFMDSPRGHVSILNLASVRDLAARVGRPIDPLRFRANLHVDGWPAWIENEGAERDLAVGAVRLRGVKPIVRCAATHVDPATGERDMDLVAALFEHYGHALCGLYASIQAGGHITVGDPVEILS